MNKSRDKLFLLLSLVCFTVVALSLFLTYFCKPVDTPEMNALKLGCGLCFWLFVILGIVFQVLVSVDIKNWCLRRKINNTKFKRTKIGLVGFFGNIPAKVSDIVWIASVITFIVFMVIDQSSIFANISLAVSVVSFAAHCIFNGKNYYYITNHEHIKVYLTKTEEK